jgi:hypothetical protein
MNAVRRMLPFVAVLSALSLVACDKPQAPPPAPKAEPPKAVAPTIDAEMKRLAAEVYVFAYPMVLMEVTRQVQVAKTPLNAFQHRRNVPDASTADTVNPNVDFLFSQAWIDLSKEPIVLSVPDTKGHYYLIAMLDAWTNVASSIGKRTTGTEKGDFAIVGPRWKGTLPGGVSEIRSPTESLFILGRTQSHGASGHAAAIRIQDQFKLAPLAKRGGKAAPAAAAGAAPGVDTKTEPREQVARMDASAFFTRFASLLPGNPPTAADAPMVEKIKKLGIVAGQPFDVGKLEPLAATSVREGAKSALDAITTAGQGAGSADVRNGWAVDRDLGRWGTDYGKRAVSAWRGLGVNAPEDAIFMTARFDGGGRRLDGANRYVLRFDKGNAPPADGFWSLSLYDDNGRFVANKLNRFSIRSDELRANADGSFDIHIQNADPAKEGNWLPAPKGSFNLMLRIYWPKQEVLDGRWTAPGIRREA